jgi:DNA-binding response OmpR family regulator
MKTILVVDDERNIVELVRLYLEKTASRRSSSTSAPIPPWWCSI